jgi:methionine-rich copper-binding protein CopC
MTALRLLICLLAVVIGSAATAAPAFAHAALIGSDPADDAKLDTAPIVITLTFNQDIEPRFATVTISGPDGTAYAAGDVRVDGPTAAIDVKPLTAAAPYVVAYRVISADGHPISGQYTFELTKAAPAAPGTTSAAAPTTSTAPTAAPASGDSGDFPMWIAVAVAAVIAGLAIVMVRRRG